MIASNNLDIVQGAAVPLFMAFRDFFPDSRSPDWTDFTDATVIRAVIRQGSSGTGAEVSCYLASYVIDGATVPGVEISEFDVSTTFDTPSNNWQIQVVADLDGSGSNFARSRILTVRVVPSISTV